MQKLTREQAAIIGAFTGIAAGPFEDVHSYAERKLGRSIFTHEFASQALVRELELASKSDFIAMCADKGSEYATSKIQGLMKQPSTMSPHHALQFATREECQAWCDANPHPVFVPVEHGFGEHYD